MTVLRITQPWRRPRQKVLATQPAGRPQCWNGRHTMLIRIEHNYNSGSSNSKVPALDLGRWCRAPDDSGLWTDTAGERLEKEAFRLVSAGMPRLQMTYR
jgi:hypothetical protein